MRYIDNIANLESHALTSLPTCFGLSEFLSILIYKNINKLKELQITIEQKIKNFNQYLIKQNIENIYIITPQQLGRGAYGQVYLAYDKNDLHKKYAVKIIPNDRIKQNLLLNEIKILQACKHENIIRFISYNSDQQYTYIATEYAAGGELFEHIIQRKYYDENDAKAIVKQILSAIFYLSENNVLHGDLKPENCLLYKIPNDYDCQQLHYVPIIKLTDFGTAKLFDKNYQTEINYGGTPGYVAPEVLMHKQFTTQPDIYSLGVLTYTLISGTHPFHANNIKDILNKQLQNNWSFNKRFEHVSLQCIDFINQCMTYDYTKRPTARQLIFHRWMQESNIKPADLSQNKQELKNIMIKIKARSGFQSMIVVNVLKEMAEDIKQKIKQNEFNE